MILVKKLEFFLYLFLVKIRLEITVTDDLEKIEAFTDFQNVNFFKVPKIAVFQYFDQNRGLTLTTWEKIIWLLCKNNIFYSLERLEQQEVHILNHNLWFALPYTNTQR